MSLRLLSVLLLIVECCGAFAAPSSDIVQSFGPDEKQEDLQKVEEENTHLFEENFTIALPPKKQSVSEIRKKENSEFYGYRQAFTFGGAGTINIDTEINTNYHFFYLLPSEKNWHWEVGAELFSAGPGSFNFGYRSFWRKFSRFRPYYKGSIALKTEGDDGIAESLQLDNYRLRAALGFENVFLEPLSYRLEIEGSVGKSEFLVLLRAGISWAWY